MGLGTWRLRCDLNKISVQRTQRWVLTFVELKNLVLGELRGAALPLARKNCLAKLARATARTAASLHQSNANLPSLLVQWILGRRTLD